MIRWPGFTRALAVPAVLAGLFVAVAASPAQASYNSYGPNYLENYNSGLCLIVQGTASGTQASQWTCAAYNDQLWMFFGTGPSNSFTIMNFNSGLCLKLLSNDAVVQSGCVAGNNWLTWVVTPTSNGGDFSIRNVATGKYLVTQTGGFTAAYAFYGPPGGGQVYADQRWYYRGVPHNASSGEIPN